MTVVDLLARLAALDVRLWLEQGNLRFSAPEGVFTPELKQQVVAAKAEIIDFLQQAENSRRAPIPRILRDGLMPASHGQQRLWVQQQLNPADITYHIPFALQFTGPLDLERLQRALQRLVERHEALRTGFDSVMGEPRQRINTTQSWHCAIVDWRSESQGDAATRAAAVKAEIQRVITEPFNLAADSLFRVEIVQVATDVTVLIVCLHHAIADAWSLDVIVKDLTALYGADSAAALPTLPIQFADYAAWERAAMRTEPYQQALRWWQQQLRDVPSPLRLKTDYQRPALPSGRGDVVTQAVPAALAAKIIDVAQAQGMTPYMVMLAAWLLLLGRLSGRTDVVTGAPVAGREHPDTQPLVGFFVNLLLLRVQLQPTMTVASLWQRVKQCVLDGFNQQAVPVDEVVKQLQLTRQPGFPALAETTFQLLHGDTQTGQAPQPSGTGGAAGLQIEALPLTVATARADLALTVNQQAKDFTLALEYSTDLFKTDSVEGVLAAYINLLQQLLAADTAQCLRALELYPLGLLQSSLELSPEIIPEALSPWQLACWETKQHEVCALAGWRALCVPLSAEQLPVATDALAELIVAAAIESSHALQRRVIPCDLTGAAPAYHVYSAAQPAVTTLTVDSISVPELRRLLLQHVQPAYAVVQGPQVSALVVNTHDNEVGMCWVLLAATQSQCEWADLSAWQQRLLHRLNIESGAAQVLWEDGSDDPNEASVETAVISWPSSLALEPRALTQRTLSHETDPGTRHIYQRAHLDHRLRVTIEEWCQAHGINAEQYWCVLWALLLRQYSTDVEHLSVMTGVPGNSTTVYNMDACMQAEVALHACFDAVRRGPMRLSGTQVLPLLVSGDQLAVRLHYMARSAPYPLVGAGASELLLSIREVPHPQRSDWSDLHFELVADGGRFNDPHALQRLLHMNEQVLFDEALTAAHQLTALAAGEVMRLTAFARGDEQSELGSTWLQSLQQRLSDATELPFGISRGEWIYSSVQTAQWLHVCCGEMIAGRRRVGVLMPRCAEWGLAVLGVAAMGVTYVPLDPALPPARLQQMLAEAGLDAVITLDTVMASAAGASVAASITDPGAVVVLPTIDPEDTNISATPAWRARAQQGALALQARLSAANPIDAAGALYTIFTSGSTGVPKGASVSRRSFGNLLGWYQAELALSENDRVMILSAPGFDLTQKNLFSAALVGAQLVLPESDRFDIESILEQIERHQITVINCAPSVFYPLLELAAATAYAALGSLRIVVLGGEAIQRERLNDWLQSSACQAQVLNSYGPTECTDVVLAEWLEPDESGAIALGKPIPNVSVHVLDPHLKPVILGAVGEIYIGGSAVGLGYWQAPELSAAAFVMDAELGRLYRTGDLAVTAADGRLYYRGRRDHQLKLNGIRIEAGDIEAALKAQPGVTDALVAAPQGRLWAWVLGSPTAQLLAQPAQVLAPYLPPPLIPVAVQALKQWPLNAHGKIDRRGLPVPLAGSEQRTRIAARTELEAVLVELWQQLSAMHSICVEADLFQQGMDSIMATRLLAHVNQRFHIQLPLSQLFLEPSLAALARAVNRVQQQAALPSITPIDRGAPLPLSFVQQQLWLLEQLEPQHSAFLMPLALDIRGRLDAGLLQCCFDVVVARHEVLRSAFVLVDAQPQVKIADELSLPLTCVDWSERSLEEQADALAALVPTVLHQPFDLTQAPLWRLHLVKLTADGSHHRLLGAFHHLISDGWSLECLLREVQQLYAVAADVRRAQLPELPVQYVDIAAWQRHYLNGDALAEHVAFWRDTLANVPAALTLPADYKRPAVLSSAGNAVTARLDADQVGRAQQLAQREQCTLFALLLTAYAGVLSRYSGQDCVCIGSPVAGRELAVAEPLLGLFINTVVVPVDLSDVEASGRTVLRQLKSRLLDVHAHQGLPFEKLVAELKPPRSAAHTPYFQAALNFLNLPAAPAAASAEMEISFEAFIPQQSEFHAKYELNLYVSPTADGHLDLQLVYSTDLYAADTMRQLLQDVRVCFSELVERPDVAVANWQLQPTPTLPAQPLRESMVARPVGHPLRSWLQQVTSQPEQIAVTQAAVSVNYGELYRRASQIAAQVRTHNGGERIAILGRRDPNLIAAMLGAWLAAGCVTILDSQYPPARLQTLIDQAAPDCLLIAFDEIEARPLLSALTLPVAPMFCGGESAVVEPSILEAPILDPMQAHVPGLEEHAYLAFTSGTEGKPKGILGSWGPVAHFIDWYTNAYAIGAQDVVTGLSGLGHDPWLRDVLVPLSVGGQLSLPPPDWFLDETVCQEWLRTALPDVLHLTPALLNVVLDRSESAAMPAFQPRLVVCGGDRLSATLAARALTLWPALTLVNGYGATETPQLMSAQTVTLALTEQYDEMPLGQGVDEVQLLVLRPDGELCQPGEVGAIGVRSPHLAVGIETEHALLRRLPMTPSRVFFTGDRGRYDRQGRVHFVGRADSQVSVRGFRVEPAEISAALKRLPNLSDALVLASAELDPQRGDPAELIAYVVGADAEPDLAALRSWLAQQLPDYMVPARWITLSNLPLTANGKVDRRRLPLPTALPVNASAVAPRNDREAEIAVIWQTVLQRETIGVTDNFFELGGHSLLAVQIVSRVRQLYPVTLSLRHLLEEPTVAGMARHVDNALWLQSNHASQSAEAAAPLGTDADDEDFEDLEI